MSQPNLIEFIWHDLGDWLGCYGRAGVRTPHLDRLAAEGAIFDQHFCTAPQCSPSRASLMTGQYSAQHGILGLTHRGWKYADGVDDLPTVLRGHGTRSILCGLQHERHDARDAWPRKDVEHTSEITFSYDERWTLETKSNLVADAAVARIDAEAERLRESPFFLSVGFSDVHRLYANDYDPTVVDQLDVPAYLPDDLATRKDLATFCYRIEQADAAVGRILEALDRAGLKDNSLIFFTTDHGPEMPRAKATLYDPGLKCALLMRLPGAIPAGSRIESLTSHLDLAPTLLTALGLPVPSPCQGRSLWQRLTTGEGPTRDTIFAQMTYHSGEYDPMRCIRTDRWKLIRNFLPGWPVQISGPYAARFGSDYVTRHFAQPRPEIELFDLESDPDELTNLAGQSEVATVEADLSRQLQEFLVATKDPILNGQIPHVAPELAGCACRWAKFQPRHPDREEFQFELVVTSDFGEQPLP